MNRSGHQDHFTRDNLPPLKSWPVFKGGNALNYPPRLNVATELIDRHVDEGRGERSAPIGDNLTWTYADLAGEVNRIANHLVAEGLEPGNRVLLRSANNPMMAAIYFAILKAGGVVVAVAARITDQLLETRATVAFSVRMPITLMHNRFCVV